MIDRSFAFPFRKECLAFHWTDTGTPDSQGVRKGVSWRPGWKELPSSVGVVPLVLQEGWRVRPGGNGRGWAHLLIHYCPVSLLTEASVSAPMVSNAFQVLSAMSDIGGWAGQGRASCLREQDGNIWNKPSQFELWNLFVLFINGKYRMTSMRCAPGYFYAHPSCC